MLAVSHLNGTIKKPYRDKASAGVCINVIL